MSPLSLQRAGRVGAGLALACSANACEPELVVGKAVEKAACSPEDTAPTDGGAGAGSSDEAVVVPWSTGFETGFCDYRQPLGYCYGAPDSAHLIVDEPVHEGKSAAAFTVSSDPAADGNQTRCVVHGTLPHDAVYGAWLYLPSLAQNTSNWNLFHFRSAPANDPNASHGIWDVSLGNGANGSLHLYVLGFDGIFRTPNPAPEVPIGSWFHVQFRLVRAADTTGQITLYQDGEVLVDEATIVTDDADVGEWYVGNLATGLTPTEFTLYVDDVTISESP